MTIIEQDLTLSQPAAPQPMILITEAAANRLLAMMREKELEGFALRVFVSGGGCSGLQYGMTFDDEMRDDDHEFYSDMLRVIVDPISASYLTGASIDFVETVMNTGFKIDNPNAVSSCGCGNSFRPANNSEGESEGEGAASGGGCSSCHA